MPYGDPDPEDPQELIGVELPGDESVVYEMAAAFADEFAQLGHSRAQILALFEQPYYAGAHQAWRLLGGKEISRLVDESIAVWGRLRWTVTDTANDETAPDATEHRVLRLIR